jgi:hypothetical protein
MPVATPAVDEPIETLFAETTPKPFLINLALKHAQSQTMLFIASELASMHLKAYNGNRGKTQRNDAMSQYYPFKGLRFIQFKHPLRSYSPN